VRERPIELTVRPKAGSTVQGATKDVPTTRIGNGLAKNRPTVLVCEDDVLIRAVIVDYLTEHGCTVLEAGNGEEAVALIDGPDQQLDVVFTDIRLGGALNGWDVAEIFRDRFPGVRIVYASGHTIEPRREIPGSTFFTKPYRFNAVLEACTR
jgi:CheY-like chemotaxis protein